MARPGAANRRGSLSLGHTIHHEDDRSRAAVMDLYLMDRWWDAAIATESQARRRIAGPPWCKAILVAGALHGLVLAATILTGSESLSTVSPGTGATMQVTMIAAWPRTGQRTPKLGTAPADATIASASGVSTDLSGSTKPAPLVDAARTDSTPRLTPLTEPTSSTPPAARSATAALADLPPSTPDPGLDVWERGVLEKIAGIKRYPARALRAGLEDTVMVRFVVNRAGKVLSAEIARSQGIALLDDEARRLLLRASPLPKLPSGTDEEMQFVVPITFSVRPASSVR